MELLFQFLEGLMKALAITLLIRLASVPLMPSFLLGTLVFLLYTNLIYPLIDPLRKFPLVDINDIKVLLPITDVPRGEAALQWAKQYPADCVRVRVLRSAIAIVPLSTEALRDLYGTYQQDFIKPSSGRHFLAYVLGYGLILAEGAAHTRQRKQLTSSFRLQNIRALHDLMSAKTDIFIRNIEAENNKKGCIEITKWASRVTLDIIGPALMSKDYDALNIEEQPVNEAFTRLALPSPALTYTFLLSLIAPQWFVRSLPTAINRAVDEDVRTVRKSCSETLDRLYGSDKKALDSHADILASIIADPDASRQEVEDQMVTFLGAGHETTAASIAWATHLLTLPEYQHYQDKLCDEVTSVSDLSATTLEKLPWVNAVCEETLRLYPPVTSTARQAARNTFMAGTRVPRGTLVVAFPWANNRDPRHWTDGERFIPERWLDERDGKLHLNGHGGASSNYANMTFLHGSRSCIGKTFAKAELRIVIAKMFGTFKVSKMPGDNGVANPVGSLTIKPEGGLRVNLKRRALSEYL